MPKAKVARKKGSGTLTVTSRPPTQPSDTSISRGESGNGRILEEGMEANEDESISSIEEL